MKKTILITGGAGFLGLHLANFLSKKKFQVFLVDIVDIDRNEYPNDCQFIKGDVRQYRVLETIIKKNKIDFIIHAAAALPLWHPNEIFEINVRGTENILKAGLKNKVKRVIFISSTAVYGVPKKHPIEENDPRVGVGSYGQSKILAEDVCFSYIKKGLPVTIIRPKTFLGTHRLGVFEILFDWIHDGKKIPVIGSGNNRYQLLEVTDLVEAIYLVIKKSHGRFNRQLNDVFNIGAERFSTVKEDLEEFFRAIGSKSKIVSTPAFVVKKILWIFEKLKLSPLYRWIYDTADKDSYVSIEKIKKVLRWQPKYSNAEALINAYRWYQKHYHEIKSRPAGVTHTVGWRQGILGLVKKVM